MKVNWNNILTDIIKYTLIGIFAIGLHLITKNAIDGHQDHETRIVALENLHTDELVEEKEPSFLGKTWNWITFKEFR